MHSRGRGGSVRLHDGLADAMLCAQGRTAGINLIIVAHCSSTDITARDYRSSRVRNKRLWAALSSPVGLAWLYNSAASQCPSEATKRAASRIERRSASADPTDPAADNTTQEPAYTARRAATNPTDPSADNVAQKPTHIA